MRLSSIISGAAILIGVCATAQASTINVSAGGNVQAAIDSAAVSGDEVVLGAGNYTGTISISGKSLVLRGASAANRPVFSFSAGVTYGTSVAGLSVLGDGTSDTIQDIVFVPGSAFTAGKAFGTATITAGATQSVSVNNCVFAPNNGSDQPLFTDPYSTTAITGGWPNDIFYFNNGAFIGEQAGVGIYNVTDCTLIGAGRDGFICYPNAAGSSLTVTGTAVVDSARNGTQWGDDSNASTAFTISGTRSKPGLILRNNNTSTASSGAGVDGINGGGVINISRLVYTGNGANTAGFIVAPDNTGNVSITNSLFASNAVTGLNLGTSGSKAPTVTVSANTFFANATDLDIESPTPTYTVKDNVFAGAGTGVQIATGVGAKVTLQNNGLVSAGTNALTTQLTGGEAPVSNTGSVSADPQFVSTTVTSLAALQTAFNVGSQAYASSSSTHGGLSGWGTAPAPVAAASDWSMFQ